MADQTPAWLTDARDQWRDNPRLRYGVWLVFGILWIYGLLVASDAVQALRERANESAQALERQRVVAMQSGWGDRAAQSQQRLDTLRAMLWSERERGIAEADVQDWIGTLAGKVGLVVRERALMRADENERRQTDTVGAAPAVAAAALPADVAWVRVRLVAEFNPAALALFMSEIASSQRYVRVDRLRIVLTGKPGLADMELLALTQVQRNSAR